MKSTAPISVRSIFQSSNLHSREQAQELYKTIIKFIRTAREIYVDFSAIQFISRSFADELVHLTSQYREENQIQFCCMNPDIEQMILAVKNTQNGRVKHFNLPVHKFPNTESLLRYFSE